MQIDQVNMPELRVASLRRVGPYGPQVGEAFCRLAGWAGKNQLFNEQAMMIGIYYDCPKSTPPEQCRMDACIILKADANPPLEEGIEIQTLPGGSCATTLCSIYNNNFSAAWEEFGRLLEEKKAVFDENRPGWREYYYHPCADSHPMHKWVVDLVVPIKNALA